MVGLVRIEGLALIAKDGLDEVHRRLVANLSDYIRSAAQSGRVAFQFLTHGGDSGFKWGLIELHLGSPRFRSHREAVSLDDFFEQCHARSNVALAVFQDLLVGQIRAVLRLRKRHPHQVLADVGGVWFL